MQTHTDEIADRIFRLSTCVPDVAPGGFTFNQFLIDADEPLLFHTGPRRMFSLCLRRSPVSFPSSDSAGSPLDTWNPMNADR